MRAQHAVRPKSPAKESAAAAASAASNLKLQGEFFPSSGSDLELDCPPPFLQGFATASQPMQLPSNPFVPEGKRTGQEGGTAGSEEQGEAPQRNAQMEAGTDEESCGGSVSVGFPGRGSLGVGCRESYGHSVSTSIASSVGSLKRWGALRNLDRSKGSSSLAISIESNPDPDTEDKENPSPFVLALPSGHDPECGTASETVQDLFRRLSGNMNEPNQPSIPSPKSPHVPGLWINQTWGRKEVEELDKDIVMGLRDVGIDTEEYFKRDHTNFPSIAHYYVNLHERLNDRLDDEVVDLLTSLENRIGVDNPLIKAMHEVMNYDGAPGANYSEALVLNVSIDNNGASKVYMNCEDEVGEADLSRQPIQEEDTEIDPQACCETGSNRDSMQFDSDFIPMVPEMNHMRNELAGLSWVVKRPSRRRLSVPSSHIQEGFLPENLPPTNHHDATGSESMSSAFSRSLHECTTTSTNFVPSFSTGLESNARITSPAADTVPTNFRAPAQPRIGLFRCCFGRMS